MAKRKVTDRQLVAAMLTYGRMHNAIARGDPITENAARTANDLYLLARRAAEEREPKRGKT